MDSEIISNINTTWNMLTNFVLELRNIQNEKDQKHISKIVVRFDKIITNISQLNGALLADGLKFSKSVENLFNRMGEKFTELKKAKSEKIKYEQIRNLMRLIFTVLWVISKTIKWDDDYLQKVWEITITNAFLKVYSIYLLLDYQVAQKDIEKKNYYIAQVMMENSELRSSIILLEDENKKLKEIISREKFADVEKDLAKDTQDVQKIQSRIDYLLWVIEKKNREIDSLKNSLERKEKELKELQNLVNIATERTKKLSVQYQKEVQRLRTEMEEYRAIATTKAFKTIKDTLTFLNRELKKLKEENTKLREQIKKIRKNA